MSATETKTLPRVSKVFMIKGGTPEQRVERAYRLSSSLKNPLPCRFVEDVEDEKGEKSEKSEKSDKLGVLFGGACALISTVEAGSVFTNEFSIQDVEDLISQQHRAAIENANDQIIDRDLGPGFGINTGQSFGVLTLATPDTTDANTTVSPANA